MRVHTSNETGPLRFLAAVRLLFVACLVGSAQTGTAAAQTDATFPESPLAIVTPDGRHDFTVEVARSPEQRAQGLMFRSKLAPDRGMLFDFGRVGEVRMWMRNTLLPLDMLFIDRAGVIRKIEASTKPLSLDTISSEAPVLAVLELNAGTSRLLGIAPGDKVEHPIFNNVSGSP